jgi:hypothetical protein
MNTYLSFHGVSGIRVEEPRQLDSGGWARTIYIDGAIDQQANEITLFGTTEASLLTQDELECVLTVPATLTPSQADELMAGDPGRSNGVHDTHDGRAHAKGDSACEHNFS